MSLSVAVVASLLGDRKRLADERAIPTPATPTPEPTAQPVSGPTFIANSVTVPCTQSPSLDAPTVLQLAPGIVLAMDPVLESFKIYSVGSSRS